MAEARTATQATLCRGHNFGGTEGDGARLEKKTSETSLMDTCVHARTILKNKGVREMNGGSSVARVRGTGKEYYNWHGCGNSDMVECIW